jgi:hypothetical protein
MRPALVIPVLLVSAFSSISSVAQESSGGNRTVTQSSMLRKAFPGGRDESDLTVQPHKRITKKEAQGDEPFEGEGPEADSIGDSEDFGE